MTEIFGNELFINDINKKYPVLEPYIKNHLSYCVPTRIIVTTEPVTFLGELYTFTKYALLTSSNTEFKHYMEEYFEPYSNSNETHPSFHTYNYILTDIIPLMDYVIDDKIDKWCRYSFSSSFDNPDLTTIIYIKCYSDNHFLECGMPRDVFAHYMSFYDCLNNVVNTRLKSVNDSCETDTTSC